MQSSAFRLLVVISLKLALVNAGQYKTVSNVKCEVARGILRNHLPLELLNGAIVFCKRRSSTFRKDYIMSIKHDNIPTYKHICSLMVYRNWRKQYYVTKSGEAFQNCSYIFDITG